MLEYENLVTLKNEVPQKVFAGITIPIRSEDGKDWEAKVVIKGLDKSGSHPVYGVDGIQAVLLAVRLLNDLLVESQEFKIGNLFIVDEEGNRDLVDQDFFVG